MTRRICIVIDAHLSTCPRMLKAADTLADVGYAVRVVSTRTTPWAMRADDDVARRRQGAWRWDAIDESRGGHRARWAAAGMRMRGAAVASRLMGTGRVPLGVVAAAQCRPFPSLVRAAASEPADLIYGGTARGLVAASTAARRLGVPYALDLEDFHSGEAADTPDGRLRNALAARIEGAVLPGATFLTAGSPAIAAAYARAYAVHPRAVHNTVPLPATRPTFDLAPDARLRLYWFSQTIGPGRGLEDAVRAAGLSDRDATLTLRGRAIPEYVHALRALAARCAPRLRLVHEDPAPPDGMVALARLHDVGLALEDRSPLNHDLALSNKAFTYLVAGLATVFTETTGQCGLAADLGDAAFTYAHGDVAALAQRLAAWASDPAMLRRAREAAWSAACRRWHWEHDEERGALLRAVERAIGAPAA